jgi:predicted Rdx family selenoprotein
MKQTIDRKKVYWMLRTGWHPERIAERLNASRRQIDRIAKANGWSGSFALTSFEDEHDLWEYYRNVFGESCGKIGLRFGRTRQAINKYFNQKQERRLAS